MFAQCSSPEESELGSDHAAWNSCSVYTDLAHSYDAEGLSSSQTPPLVCRREKCSHVLGYTFTNCCGNHCLAAVMQNADGGYKTVGQWWSAAFLMLIVCLEFDN